MAINGYYPSFSSKQSGIEHGDWSVPSVITKDSLRAAQAEVLCKIMDLLAINKSHARTLLIHYRWNLERICEALERKGEEHLFCEAGVPNNNNNKAIGFSISHESDFTCNVCFEQIDLQRVQRMECGHCFCDGCWTEHFITSINNGQGRRIQCMGIKCRTICNEDTIHRLLRLKHPDMSYRFDRLLMESYIEDNDRVKWCPSTPPCGNAVRVEGDTYCEVECTCGTRFCFNCLSEDHSPCPCRIWGLWVKKCEIESMNMDWIAANTKSCPKCYNVVVKEGGCNHVMCRCGQSFCWLCGCATGRDHSRDRIEGHTCNRFTSSVSAAGTTRSTDNQKTDPAEPVANKLSRHNVQRYIHYYDRYKAHAESLEKETDHRRSALQRASAWSSGDGQIRDEEWIVGGIDRLVISRRALSYTYPFAYYMFGDELEDNNLNNREIRRDLFEDQQQQLECCVEKLAMLLEKQFYEIAPDEVAETRRHVVTLSRLLDKCCKDMYDCIQDELLPYLSVTEFIAPYKSKGIVKAKEISV